MAEQWFTRTLSGCAPADEDCERALKRFAIGATFPMDLSGRKTRSLQWHRKYFQLCTMLAQNLDEVEIEPGLVLQIHSKDDVHIALKYATGLFDSYALKSGIVRIIRSTAFDRMTAEEWVKHWPKVLDAVHQKFLPNISIASVENELARMAS